MCTVITGDTFKRVFSPLIFNINEAIVSTIPDKTIGDKIKKLRISLGLTQLQFSKSIHRGFGTVSKWEQNLTIPKPDVIKNIIILYNLSDDYFNL